jgi:hypothetical protein
LRRLPTDEKVDFALGRRASVRIYADTRPRVQQTMGLQKGAHIVVRGVELAEEGVGIGTPVCLYKDGAHFSSDAVTYLNPSKPHPSAVKIYDMNAVEAKTFRGTTIKHASFTRRFLRILERAYRGMSGPQFGQQMMLKLVSIVGLRNEYSKSTSKGQVSVTFEPRERELQITVDFERLAKDGLQAIMIGNEQGGRVFTEYSDSSGQTLDGKQIEAWRLTSANWASLWSPKDNVGFRLRTESSGWQIARGREVVENRISWSGLNLISEEFPLCSTLRYRVEFLGDL